ncbi:hypothetical protein ABZ646_22795, partial [Streptomyces sp. NPDC007162]
KAAGPGETVAVRGFHGTEFSMPACRENLRQYGHLGPNDVFLNLRTALDRKELAPGDLAVLINVSPVAAWSLLLVETGSQEGTA